jgi:hypothetical protein
MSHDHYRLLLEIAIDCTGNRNKNINRGSSCYWSSTDAHGHSLGGLHTLLLYVAADDGDSKVTALVSSWISSINAYTIIIIIIIIMCT